MCVVNGLFISDLDTRLLTEGRPIIATESTKHAMSSLMRLCSAVLLCMLAAGLWPFHAPGNRVSWLTKEDGLNFGRYGSILSVERFPETPQRRDGPCSIEIWLQARRVSSSGTILAFYRPDSRIIPFSLRQSLSDLTLEQSRIDDSGKAKKVKIYVDDVLSHPQPVLITISSSHSGTAVFADGAFVRKFENFELTSQDLTGRLILGNSPVAADSWSGLLKGLTLYNRSLTADEVSGHFLSWANGNRPDLSQREGAVALYLFDERHGNIVHNHVDSATDLLIPKRFFVLHARFLERPWNEFRLDWNYLKDVCINVAGFIPLGFFFYAYFSLLRRVEHPLAITIAFGFAVSLTIEVLQAFLPTRDSGMTDLITNTLGSAIGVMVFRHRAVDAMLAVAGLRPYLLLMRQTLVSRSSHPER